MMKVESWNSIVDSFQKKNILVLGDIILDEYIIGEVERICPEAPVPVVRVSQRNFHLGGAANVVHNLRALGAQTSLCGVVGGDDSGRKIYQLLDEIGVDHRSILIDESRPTIQKSRVIARRQQIVRFDNEKSVELAALVSARLFQEFCDRLPTSDIVIVSDYAKGVLSRHFFQEIAIVVHKASKKLIVDPKRQDLHFYRGASVLTPNFAEACRFAQNEEVCASLEKLGGHILSSLDDSSVIITLGGDGMAVFEKNLPMQFMKTKPQEVFEVSGAGDTVLSLLSLGLVSGLSLSEAASLANTGAGLVVKKMGTATVTPEELKQALL
ncbi:MAG: D-glycero-beta-D-manno-heptose-7-phosphate kinase [Deltaproteobacteria bacterium]|nr:D-glycero-beta-D-manno-heptose-7-phosphate kinase [Deltaproteobacteria bacterium]